MQGVVDSRAPESPVGEGGHGAGRMRFLTGARRRSAGAVGIGEAAPRRGPGDGLPYAAAAEDLPRAPG